jgi:phospholipid transport system transporter-binding protein
MSQPCELKLDTETGYINVCGDLTFATVNDLLISSRRVFTPITALDIDLADVSCSDSAGLALLIDWMRLAKQQNKNILFHNIPAQMLAMAHASGLDELLPLQ